MSPADAPYLADDVVVRQTPRSPARLILTFLMALPGSYVTGQLAGHYICHRHYRRNPA